MFKTLMRWYVLLALSLVPLMARAEGEVTLDSIIGAANNGTDKSLALLGFIFGHGNGVNFSGGGRFEQVFVILNGVALALGLVYFIFVAVSGIAQTAHDGEFLGKRYSSIWLPIRFSIGTMSMVPIVGGWGIAQIAMLWMAVMGVGSANLVVEAAISHGSVFDQGDPKLPLPSPSVRLAAIQMLEANICMEAINKGIEEAKHKYEIDIDPADEIHPYIKDGKIRFVNEGGFFVAASRSCGEVQFDIEDRESWTTKLFNYQTLNLLADKTHGDPLYGAKVAGLNQMQSILNASAKRFVDGEPFDEAAVNAAGDAYQRALFDGMSNYHSTQEVADQKNKADEILRSGGWIMLGAMYQSYATFSSSIRDSLSKVPEVEGPDSPSKFVATYNQYWNEAHIRFSVVANRIEQDYVRQADSGQYATYKTPGLWAIEAIKNLANKSAGNSLSFPDPLIGMKNIGDTIIIGAESFWVGGKVLGWLAKRSPAGQAISLVNEKEKEKDNNSIIGMMMYVLLFTGIVLSIWVPMIPFVTWIAACMSWLVIVCESVISAPLLAMAHLEAEGEGMGQRTTHGYMFAINLLLRPMLIAIGFIFAWLILTAAASLVSSLFMIAVENAQIDEAGGTSLTGPASIIGYIVIYGIIMLMLVNKSFELIHVIPETVTAWLGGHIRSDHGRGGEKDSHGMVIGAVNQSKVALGSTPKKGKDNSPNASDRPPRQAGSSGGGWRTGGHWADPGPAPMRDAGPSATASSKPTKHYDLD